VLLDPATGAAAAVIIAGFISAGALIVETGALAGSEGLEHAAHTIHAVDTSARFSLIFPRIRDIASVCHMLPALESAAF
jgi:hypothetical protein